MSCTAPIPLETLIAYVAGELDDATEDALEGHYFGCAGCTDRLETVQRLRAGVVSVVRGGAITASVTAAFVERAEAGGLSIRSYRVDPGEEVFCTAAPTDDFVAIRLGLDVDHAEEVDVAVTWTALATGDTHRDEIRGATFDREARELVMLFAGDRIRAVPRSRWSMEATFGAERRGPYRLLHTPWDELER